MGIEELLEEAFKEIDGAADDATQSFKEEVERVVAKLRMEVKDHLKELVEEEIANRDDEDEGA